MPTVPLDHVLTAMTMAGVQRFNAGHWIARQGDASGGEAWESVLEALKEAVALVEERRRIEAARGATASYKVQVVSEKPSFVIKVAKREGRLEAVREDAGVQICFGPRTGPVLQVLCRDAPSFVSEKQIAARVSGLIGFVEQRMTQRELTDFFEFEAVKPWCKMQPSEIKKCDFNPREPKRLAPGETPHSCAELALCPFDVVLLPVDRKAYENLRRPRFAATSVRKNIEEIRKRIVLAVRGRDDAHEWKDGLVTTGGGGKGWALAAEVEWPEERT